MIIFNKRILILANLFLLLIFSSCEKDISTSPPEPEPPQGFIFVDSNPQNYKIYLDERFTGRFTPDTLQYVEETEHLIEIKRKYWLDSSAISIAESGVIKSVYIDLFQSSKIYGDLKLFSTPEGASVVINDSLTDIKTPYILEGLLPGLYRVEYHKEQHRPNSTRIAVESNKVKSVSLALQDTSIWVDFTKKNSDIPNNNVTTLAVDKDNRLWVGTVNSGIVTIKGKEWKFINKGNSGLPTDSIRVIKVDNNNTVWIGTYKGLVEYKNGSVQKIIDQSNSPMYVDRVNDIDFTIDNIIFVGCNVGLLKIEGSSMKLSPNAEQKVERNVSALAVNRSTNEVWVAIKGNIVRYDWNKETISYNERNSVFFDYINDFYVSKLMVRPADNKLWAFFSSEGGGTPNPVIAVWNGEKWSYEKQEKVNLIFTDAITDHENYVWIASNMGLGKFETRSMGYFYVTNSSLIFSNNLTAVAEDNNGTLWIGSHDGLFKYKKGSLP